MKKTLIVIVLLIISLLANKQYKFDKQGNKINLIEATEDILTAMRPMKPSHSSFLEISNDKSGDDNENISKSSKTLIVFALNLVVCIVCCGLFQWIVKLSKSMNKRLTDMRINYNEKNRLRQFQEFQKVISNMHKQQMLSKNSQK